MLSHILVILLKVNFSVTDRTSYRSVAQLGKFFLFELDEAINYCTEIPKKTISESKGPGKKFSSSKNGCYEGQSESFSSWIYDIT